MVQPKDAGLMVEMTNADRRGRSSGRSSSSICRCPRAAPTTPISSPLERLKLGAGTELYLGLIHYNDAAGDAARLAAARRHARVDGIGTECGMARGDPARLPALLAAHARAAELVP